MTVAAPERCIWGGRLMRALIDGGGTNDMDNTVSVSSFHFRGSEASEGSEKSFALFALEDADGSLATNDLFGASPFRAVELSATARLRKVLTSATIATPGIPTPQIPAPMSSVSEPLSVTLVGCGLIIFAAWARRKLG